MEITVGARLETFKCHKEVLAAKISKIVRLLEGEEGQRAHAAGAHLHLESGGFQIVDQGWLRQYKPHVGGYLVVYKDGYMSYSPADAFEEGYTAF